MHGGYLFKARAFQERGHIILRILMLFLVSAVLWFLFAQSPGSSKNTSFSSWASPILEMITDWYSALTDWVFGGT